MGLRLKVLLACASMILVMFVGIVMAQDTTTGECPLGKGYWSAHPAEWPLTSLALGSQTYSAEELIILLNNADNDASSQLAAHLIAAKLNLAAGVSSSLIEALIAQADALLVPYPGKLPYNVEPSSSAGLSMNSIKGILEDFNEAVLNPGCDDDAESTAEPEVTETPAPEVTETPSPEATETPEPETTPEAGQTPIIIVIEGPVQEINVNIITIFDIDIELEIDDPVLTVIQVGDVIRVEGELFDRGTTIIIVAVTIVFVEIDIVINDGIIWRDPGDCSNPPPPWAPADGWRRRCEGGGSGGGGGNDDDDGMGDDDDDGMGMGMGD